MAAAMIAAPVMSSAGSSVCQERTSSTYLLPRASKRGSVEAPAEQCTMPSWKPPRPPSKLSAPFGPLTTAPTSSGAVPSRLPDRLATWCCMQRGKRVPTPTMAPTPQGSPPSSQVRCAVANAW